MTDKKPQPDVTKVITDTGTIRIETPASKGAKGHRRTRAVVDLVTPDEFVGGFVDFLREHAIVGLAIGFAIGSQAQQLVKTVVSGFIDPAFSLFFGKALSNRTFTLHFRHHFANFGWGSVVYGLLDFLFVLAAIYLIVKLLALDKLDKPKEEAKK